MTVSSFMAVLSYSRAEPIDLLQCQVGEGDIQEGGQTAIKIATSSDIENDQYQ